MEESIRVQKYLSQKGLFSRRQVEGFIRAGKLNINGETAKLGDRVKPSDIILLNGKPLEVPEEVKTCTLAFYKPKGVETTLQMLEDGVSLADYDFGVGRVFPIGRLDKDSHGLLLLTNDGELSNRLMHPRFKKEKEYLVSLHKKIDQNFCSKIEKGIDIDGTLTAPCKCEIIEPTIVKITLTEGRNRQIRRMCGKLGYEVIDLLRIKFGDIELGKMKEGAWRKIDLS